MPDLGANRIQLLLGALATFLDFEKSVQKAEDDDNLRKQRFPGGLGWGPAIGIDRVGTIAGIKLMSFLLKGLVALEQGLCAGTVCQICAQDTFLGHGGGYINPLPLTKSGRTRSV